MAGRPSQEISFDWDNENTAHLGRHGITPDEAEEVFRNDPVIKEYEVVNGEDRWTAVGVSSTLRVLVLIFAMRGPKIRVFTGWEADRRTKKAYFTERGM